MPLTFGPQRTTTTRGAGGRPIRTPLAMALILPSDSWALLCSSGALLYQAGAIQLSARDLISDAKTPLGTKNHPESADVASEHSRLVLDLLL